MSRKSKYSVEEKLAVILKYKNGEQSRSQIIKQWGISTSTFREWLYNYEKYGLSGLGESKTFKKYSKELKEQAVQGFLSGLYSKSELVKKYEISTRSILSEWIKKYNSHIELKDTGKGMGAIMTKGRNTTWKERIEIVQFCIASSFNYQQTAEKYKVSYQQVYTWVKKYVDDGEEALKDRRGKKKDEENLTPEEVIELKLKKLEIENKRLKAENLLLKKLDEIERRRS